MITSEELRLLTFLTQATSEALQTLQRQLHGAEAPATILQNPLLQAEDPRLEVLHLPPRDDRAEALATLMVTMSPKQYEWIREVMKTSWDHEWSSSAYGLFFRAEQLGIPSVATYSIVAASMTLQGSATPERLSARLQAARRSAKQQREHLASSVPTPEQLAMLKEAQAKSGLPKASKLLRCRTAKPDAAG